MLFRASVFLLLSIAGAYADTRPTASFSSSSLDIEISFCERVTIDITQPLNHTTNIWFEYQLNDNDPYESDVAKVHNVIENVKPVNITSGMLYSPPFNICGASAGRIIVSANSSDLDVAKAYTKVTVVYALWIETFSVVIGWVYFAAWSVSFYPQVILNWYRKSVVGLSFDFTVLNFVGHTSYAIYNSFYYWDPAIYDQYLNVNPRGVNPVQLNDVLFSLHASVLTAVQVVQILIYERGDQTVSIFVRVMIVAIILFYLVSLIPAIVGTISWLLYLTFFSYVKLLITLVKYIPQAWLNYKRKSTEGWSIWNILLDFTGGSLSMLQMILISYNHNDWASMFIDLTKFALGMFSILFDILFMVQHYCLYSKSNKVHVASDDYQNAEAGEVNRGAANEGDNSDDRPRSAKSNGRAAVSNEADESAALVTTA